jgi:hypothetical protein
VFDPRRETYEQYLERWETELGDTPPTNPFEPAEYKDGQPYPPPDERRDLPRILSDV